MPRPLKANPVTDGFKTALQALRQQQEQSLAAIEALLETCGVEAFQPSESAAIQAYPIKEDELPPHKEPAKQVSQEKPPTPSMTALGFSATGSKFRDLMTESNADDPSSKTWLGRVRWLISKPQFDWAMGVVIFLNSICIGIETQRSISDELLPDWPREALDLTFISIYVVEISMRIFAYGKSNFKDSWFLFDFALVGMGLAGIIVDSVSEDGGDTPFAKVLVVRSLRLLRLVRAIRMLHMFRTVWRLVYGLLTSGNTMLSTFFILLLTLYIFACLGVELITKDPLLQRDPDTKDIVAYHFGSLQRTLLTLVSFVSADSIAQVYMPICIVRPFMVIYFIIVILTVSVSLMNLVTAVLVEGALANAANDKELGRHDMKQKVRKFAPKVMQVFAEIDEDGSGTIDRHEVTRINLDELPIELNSEHVESLEDLFDMLDVEGKGTLTQAEFADGLLNLLTMDVPVHQMKTFKILPVMIPFTGSARRLTCCLMGYMSAQSASHFVTLANFYAQRDGSQHV
ncbi:unnamed protein product, partial [Cladocopium goreaui]